MPRKRKSQRQRAAERNKNPLLSLSGKSVAVSQSDLSGGDDPIAARINQLRSAAAPEPEDTVESALSQPETVTLTNDQLQTLLTQVTESKATEDTSVEQLSVAQSQIEELQAQLAAKEQESTEAVEQAQLSAQETEQATRESEQAKLSQEQLMAQLHQLLGVAGASPEAVPAVGSPQGLSAPNVNRLVSRSDKVEGPAAEVLSAWDGATPIRRKAKDGRLYVTRDQRPLQAALSQQRTEDGKWNPAFLSSMEEYAKRNGMLQGGVTGNALAATVRGDVPEGFLDTLSGMMRFTHAPNRIMHQFPNLRFDPGMSNGDTILIPRASRQVEPTTANDRLLSGNGVHVPIVAGRTNVQTGSVNIVLQEYGRGGNADSEPIMVTDFIAGYSMISLMNILNENLRYDFLVWEDIAIRELWDPTSVVYYNAGGTPTINAGDVVAGQDGRMNRVFLANLYAEMRALQFPTMSNGRYGLVVNTYSATNLRLSLEDMAKPPTEMDVQNVTNMLNFGREAGMTIERASGYMGSWENFEVFETNAFGVGAAGTAGVQSEALGVGTVDTHTSYAFGAQTIGQGIGMDMEIRQDEIRDFGRTDAFIWLTHRGFTALDVDPIGYNDTSLVPQQLRVVKLHNTRLAA